MRLDGKRVVIIGGSSGIGLESARLALADGAFVTIAGRSEGRLRRRREPVVHPRHADTAGPASLGCRRRHRRAVASSPVRGEERIDHLFLPAGELRPGGGSH